MSFGIYFPYVSSGRETYVIGQAHCTVGLLCKDVDEDTDHGAA